MILEIYWSFKIKIFRHLTRYIFQIIIGTFLPTQHLGMQVKQWIMLINDTYWHKSEKSQEIYNGMSKKVAISNQVYAK